MPEKHFDCEYKLPLPYGNIGFLSVMMKMAFNDSLLVGRAKVKDELTAINNVPRKRR